MGFRHGVRESAALSSTAEFLELALAGGELVPGARGWKAHSKTPPEPI
jgi:hypothetical protein